MDSLSEGENSWNFKVETQGKIIVENLNLLPGFLPDSDKNPGIFHVPILTRESAESAARLLEENYTIYHIFCCQSIAKE